MKKTRKINREIKGKTFSAGGMRTGCILMAAVLVCFGPGAGQIHAASATEAAKKVVSQNNVPKDAGKNKAGTPAASTVQPTGAPAVAAGSSTVVIPQATGLPQVTSALQVPGISQITSVPSTTVIPQVTSVPSSAAIPQITTTPSSTVIPQAASTPSAAVTTQTPEKTDEEEDSDDDEKTDSTGQEEQGTGQESGDGEDREEIPASGETVDTEEIPTVQETAGPEGGSQDLESSILGESGSSEVSQGESTGNVSGTDAGMIKQPSDPGYDGYSESSFYAEEESEEIPVVGLVEGASTIIVGGLAPAVPAGSYGQEEGNENIEDEGGQEDQGLIAGSTPLVGGVIADDGYGTAGSTSSKNKTTVTPKVTTVPAAGSTGGSASAVSTVTPAASAQNQTVAMDTSGQRAIVPAAAPSGGSNAGSGQLTASVRTEDNTNILLFILVGAAALAAIAVLVVLKVKRGRKGRSGTEQE